MADVDSLSSAPGWVTEWQYRQARPLLAERADIIRWGWQTRNKFKAAVPVLAQSQPHLQIVRLRSPREVEHWVKNLRRALAAGW